MNIALKFDLERMRQYVARGGSPPFGIALEHEGVYYPDAQWDDFGLVLLGWWCGAALRLAEGSTEEGLQFMEGPYRALVRVDRASGMTTISFEDRPADQSMIWHIPFPQLADALVEATKTAQGPLDSIGMGKQAKRLLSLARKSQRTGKNNLWALPDLGSVPYSETGRNTRDVRRRAKAPTLNGTQDSTGPNTGSQGMLTEEEFRLLWFANPPEILHASGTMRLVAPLAPGAFGPWVRPFLDGFRALIHPYALVSAVIGLQNFRSLNDPATVPRLERAVAGGKITHFSCDSDRAIDRLRYDAFQQGTDLAEMRRLAGDAHLVVELPEAGKPGTSLRLYASCGQATAADRQQLVARLVPFARQWRPPFEPYSVYIDPSIGTEAQWVGPSGFRSHLQQARGVLPFEVDEVQRRYLEDVSWAMYLGPDLCNHLGGQAQVLATAPCAVVEPFGDGVWLQLSESPPPSYAAYAQAFAYLAPVLDWDTAWIDSVTRAQYQTPSQPPSAVKFVPTALFPVLLENETDEDIPLTVYLKRAPSDKQTLLLERAVRAWADAGQSQVFGDQGLDNLDGPAVDPAHRRLRWTFDIGEADFDAAVASIGATLEALKGVTVTKVVIGREEADED